MAQPNLLENGSFEALYPANEYVGNFLPNPSVEDPNARGRGTDIIWQPS